MKPQNEIATLYSGETASKYTDLVSGTAYIGPEWLETNLKLHKIPSVSLILDLGCADGINARALLDLYPKAKLIGADITPDMIACAKLKAAYSELHQANVDEGLEFLNGQTADIAVCIGVAEFFTNLPRFIRNLAAHLKAGALAFMTFQEHEKGNPNAPRQTRSGVVPHFAHTENEIIELFANNQFKLRSLEKKVGYKSGRGYECPYILIVAEKI